MIDKDENSRGGEKTLSPASVWPSGEDVRWSNENRDGDGILQ